MRLLTTFVVWFLRRGIHVAFLVTDQLGRLMRRAQVPRAYTGPVGFQPNRYGLGVSVIVPERANPVLLRDCLQSVSLACARLTEPFEVIVVVNGSCREDYRALEQEHSGVTWIFEPKPLWFVGAIRLGVSAARFDWVYLLNNDVTLDTEALRRVLEWRAPRVFAVASQIFFKDPDKRREETGWTHLRPSNGLLHAVDEVPTDDAMVRGTAYAGGGASLFRRELLAWLAHAGRSYVPGYWEDIEWGTRAWRLGYESLFCPSSKAWHTHRATHRKVLTEAAIDAAFRRNGWRYQARNPMPGNWTGPLLEHVGAHDLSVLANVEFWARALAGRLSSYRYPWSPESLQHVTDKVYPNVVATEPGARPVVLLVSPYCVFPPRHGGAMRIDRLLRTLNQHFQVVLLSDECSLYAEASREQLSRCAAVHLVSGRPDDAQGSDPRIARIQSHSHERLKEEFQRVFARYRPALVQIEYVELAGLVDLKSPGVPWLLTLHDVLLSEDSTCPTDADRFEQRLIERFDRVITCCREDARLLAGTPTSVIPNGFDPDSRPYVASQSSRLMFTGPFRYRPNFDGIRAFLEEVYPRLQERVPGIELHILSGGKTAETDRLACFRQPGVRLLDFVTDPRPLLDSCALTINPLVGVRGSCLKVIESLAAGRVCVSTTEGAR